MRHLQISLLLIVVVFATGCPKYKPEVKFDDPNSLVSKINKYIMDQNSLYIAALGSNPDKAKLIRNELIERAVPFIDGAYIDFITDIQAGRDRNNFVMDLVELGATASVGITNGERPLQIIGIALTAFRGGRRSLDLNFYKDQSTPILITKMDGNRAKVRANILDKQTKEVEDYPLPAAIGDLVEYYNAGTLVRAFTELQKDTAVQTKISEDRLIEAKKMLGVVGAPTEDQINESKQNFVLVRRITKKWSDAEKIKKAAEAAKRAEAAKANQQPPLVPDPQVLTAQQAIIDDQAKIQQAVLDDYRELFDVILADPKLKAFLDQIPVASSDGDRSLQQSLQASLDRIKHAQPDTPPPTIRDYDSIMLKLSGLISEAVARDPSLAGQLKTKLLTSKTLNDPTP